MNTVKNCFFPLQNIFFQSQTEKEKEKDNLISRHITQECENTMDDTFSRALTAAEDTKCSLPVDISKLCSESNSEKINHTGHNPPTAESRDTKVYIWRRPARLSSCRLFSYKWCMYSKNWYIYSGTWFFSIFFSIFSPQILPNENNKTKVDVHELFHESLTPTPLEIHDFYGPEVRVTNEDLCIVESFPCY